MNIEVMSRSAARRYAFKPHPEKVMVISITDPGSEPNGLRGNANNGIYKIVRAEFEDTDDPNTSISAEQAKMIAEQVSQNIDVADKIIVHCEAGQSRSAGTAAAILKFYTNDDTQIFDNPRYTPNMYVYRKMLEAFYDLQ